LTRSLPEMIHDARTAVAAGARDHCDAAHVALVKALQLGGHLAIELDKTDLALSSLEKGLLAAESSEDPLLAPMMSNSIAWAYQQQNRLADAQRLAIDAAERLERHGPRTAEDVRVWGGLLISAATSAARTGDYGQATDILNAAEAVADRLTTLPPPDNGKMVSVFNRSAVQIERVRLAVQHGQPHTALALAHGIRLSSDTPPSWRAWLMLDIARARKDLGDAEGAVKVLQALYRFAPQCVQSHALAAVIVSDLLAGRARPPGLRRLAETLGVVPSNRN
jgi:tetratricopeptide (TPR) repeat protein